MDLKKEAAVKVADEINGEGGTAISLVANVLEKDSLESAKKEVNDQLER
ncbi:hypothetical protein [Maribacter aquimaris]|nr:hypothetical protein [Maribacter aquimaris]